MHRKGEPFGSSRFRSVRFVLINGSWYFSTREGIDVGPFNSRHVAARACERLIAQLSGQFGAKARETVANFVRFQIRREDRAIP
jgi:hypothetical protein